MTNYALDWTSTWLHLFVKFHFSSILKDKDLLPILMEIKDIIKDRTDRIEGKLFKLQAILN